MEVSNSASELKTTAQNNPCLLVVNLICRQWAIQSGAVEEQGRVDFFDGKQLQLGAVDTQDPALPDTTSKDDEAQGGEFLAGVSEIKTMNGQPRMTETDPATRTHMPGAPTLQVIHERRFHPNVECDPDHVPKLHCMSRPFQYLGLMSNARDVAFPARMISK